jgi:SAM-dependent methyltransferase
MKPWHEDDRFWQMRGRFHFGPKVWERAPEEVEQALALLDVAPGAAVLDLCCGIGRHSIELARRGFRVTGVDRTRVYLDEARERAAAEGLDIEFVEEDARVFRREAAFDAAINMFTSFGYFEDQADDRRVLQNVRSSLRQGAPLLMDTLGKERLARIFTPRSWEEADGVLMLAERTMEDDWTMARNREIYIDGTDRWEITWRHRIYSAAELKALLMGEGFGEVRVFGDLAGAPYDQNAMRLVALARR